jgi:hypothetical protein
LSFKFANETGASGSTSYNNASCGFTITIEPPEDASKEEVEIHELLDSLDVRKIDVKSFLEDQQRIDSPNIRKAFDELNCRQSQGADSASSHKSPSFL